MRVLITSIPVRSGVHTHVKDLAHFLHRSGVRVVIALKKLPGHLRRPVLDLGLPFHQYESADELVNMALKNDIQLIHAQSSATFPSALRASIQVEKPLVITLHGAWNWHRFRPYTLAHAKRIIAVSPDAVRSVHRQQQRKVCLIYNGIDTNRFAPKSPFVTPTTSCKIIWFGRTHGPDRLGLRALDEALLNLKQQGFRINASMLGVAHNFTPRAMKPLGWRHNPLFVLKSSHIAFGRGRSLREAMSCGNAGFLLGRGYGGIVRPSWFEGQTRVPLSASYEDGFPPADVRAIANDMAELLNNRPVLQKHRAEARSMAVRFFDVRTMVNKTITIYEEALL